MNPLVAGLLGLSAALGAVAAVALIARVRRAARPRRVRAYVPTAAQARWATARRAEIDIESTIIIPAGDVGTGAGQWSGMIRRSFPDDHLRR